MLTSPSRAKRTSTAEVVGATASSFGLTARSTPGRGPAPSARDAAPRRPQGLARDAALRIAGLRLRTACDRRGGCGLCADGVDRGRAGRMAAISAGVSARREGSLFASVDGSISALVWRRSTSASTTATDRSSRRAMAAAWAALRLRMTDRSTRSLMAAARVRKMAAMAMGALAICRATRSGTLGQRERAAAAWRRASSLAARKSGSKSSAKRCRSDGRGRRRLSKLVTVAMSTVSFTRPIPALQLAKTIRHVIHPFLRTT